MYQKLDVKKENELLRAEVAKLRAEKVRSEKMLKTAMKATDIVITGSRNALSGMDRVLSAVQARIPK